MSNDEFIRRVDTIEFSIKEGVWRASQDRV